MTAPPAGRRHRWPRPRGLLLDAMGTLIGLRRSVGSTYAEVSARHGIHVDPAALERAFPALYRSAPPLAFPGLEGEALAEAERRWWGDLIDAALGACGAAPAAEILHRELFDTFADPGLWFVHPDVPERLESWRRSGLRLAVVSNFDQRLEGLLAGLGLTRWFDAVVISSRAGAAKPSPAPFRQALEQLALEAGEVWHVGDAPEDSAGARAAGIRCVIVRRP